MPEVLNHDDDDHDDDNDELPCTCTYNKLPSTVNNFFVAKQ